MSRPSTPWQGGRWTFRTPCKTSSRYPLSSSTLLRLFAGSPFRPLRNVYAYVTSGYVGPRLRSRPFPSPQRVFAADGELCLATIASIGKVDPLTAIDASILIIVRLLLLRTVPD